jgi:hypothetical protein
MQRRVFMRNLLAAAVASLAATSPGRGVAAGGSASHRLAMAWRGVGAGEKTGQDFIGIIEADLSAGQLRILAEQACRAVPMACWRNRMAVSWSWPAGQDAG